MLWESMWSLVCPKSEESHWQGSCCSSPGPTFLHVCRMGGSWTLGQSANRAGLSLGRRGLTPPSLPPPSLQLSKWPKSYRTETQPCIPLWRPSLPFVSLQHFYCTTSPRCRRSQTKHSLLKALPAHPIPPLPQKRKTSLIKSRLTLAPFSLCICIWNTVQEAINRPRQ